MARGYAHRGGGCLTLWPTVSAPRVFGGGSRMPRRRRLRVPVAGSRRTLGLAMTHSRNDVAGPTQGTRVAGTPDPQPAGTEHDPAGAAEFSLRLDGVGALSLGPFVGCACPLERPTVLTKGRAPPPLLLAIMHGMAGDSGSLVRSGGQQHHQLRRALTLGDPHLFGCWVGSEVAKVVGAGYRRQTWTRSTARSGAAAGPLMWPGIQVGRRRVCAGP